MCRQPACGPQKDHQLLHFMRIGNAMGKEYFLPDKVANFAESLCFVKVGHVVVIKAGARNGLTNHITRLMIK